MNVQKRPEKPMKRPVNLSVDADLVADAKSLGFNLSQIFENALQDVVREERKRRWQEENREAIEAYNDRIEKHGTFGERLWRR